MELLKGRNPGGIAFAWIRLAALGLIISIAIQVGRCEVEPTESQCRPYIEKALKEQHIGEAEKADEDWIMLTEFRGKGENVPADELTETIEVSVREEIEGLKTEESPREQEIEEDDSEAKGDGSEEEEDETKDEIEFADQMGDESEVNEDVTEFKENEEPRESDDVAESEEEHEEEEEDDIVVGQEEPKDEDEKGAEEEQDTSQEEDLVDEDDEEKSRTSVNAEDESREREAQGEDEDEGEKETKTTDKGGDYDSNPSEDSMVSKSESDYVGDDGESNAEEIIHDTSGTEGSSETWHSGEAENVMEEGRDIVEEILEKKLQDKLDIQVKSTDEVESQEQESDVKPEKEDATEGDEDAADEEGKESGTEAEADEEEEEVAEAAIPHEDLQSAEADGEPDLTPEEDLTKEATIPENLRSRDHITQILRLDEDSVETESILEKAIDSTLKSLKGLYDNAIKPLEMLYKYRDLSNRHFGDPEIFSKPLILFMGPWSGGKSTTINYLLDNEFTEMSLRTGAEPSPAYFNIIMHGNEEEVLDGTQLAADWTFSGLQKFGQSLLDRLKGYKLPNRLLEKVNIVEIPGILEIRKQVQRLFPFNDACQWFIDRADIIFLVYDPSKLDVGPETEAILDQLKGREYQTRIILNKADQVKPEELMRVQGTLIWNISPLMSSTEPPVMYTTSLWSLPYESGAPTRLLSAQEKAFLRDLREAIDKRVENKIAGARRFAVRVRNHAKMVDCYLTTYYNHKTFFGNKKKISDDIIENPQKYHIYEGLSTLTNISRYDLPDPDVYRDFFKLNSLYDFKKLSDTCTYFRGCPINTLDVAIAYDLPELVGKYKKAVEASKAQTSQKSNG